MAKAKIAQYQFNTEPVVVVTPEAETLFMCLADVNEVSGCYGGKLVFTKNALNSQVKFKKGKGKEEAVHGRTSVDKELTELKKS